MYVCTIFRFLYVCSRLFLFPFSLAFCFTKIACETLCRFLYFYASLKCMFMQSIMVNRKLFGNFEFFSTFAETFYLFTFCFFAFSLILDNLQKMKTETKKPLLVCFCRKTSVFIANKTLIFSNLYLYRVIYTPPPRFWHSQGGSALIRFFYFFIFYFFCKILRFFKFRFSTEF